MPPLEPLDEFHYHHRLREAGGVALVLFSSPTCGTCRVVERRLPEAAPAGTRLFRVDVQASQALARAYEVFHLPALLLYRDGLYHARLDCEVSAPALHAAVREALAAPPQEEP
ncbi:MAG: thioredoxin family protein [Pseudomonadota bacterium]